MELNTESNFLLKTRTVKTIIAASLAISCFGFCTFHSEQAFADSSTDKQIPVILQLSMQIDQIQDEIQQKAEYKNTVGKVIEAAQKLKGTPYVYGGSTPAGFDCSGFTMYCYSKIGVKLKHNAAAQYNQGKHVSRKNLKKGDLVFFGSKGSINHVGIYIGDGKMIHSPHTGAHVRIEGIDEHGRYVGACRVLK